MNNLEFDHADIFRDLADIQRTFSHLVRIVPRNGCVVYNADDANLAPLLPVAWTRTIKVTADTTRADADVCVHGFQEGAAGAHFRLTWRGRTWAEINWTLPGLFNARNAAMAATAAGLALFPDDPTRLDLGALARFRGVKRRQEILVDRPELVVVEDFGHHPTAIRETIHSLRARYPGRAITAAFEPRSNTARTNVLQAAFLDALAEADRIVLGAVNRADKLQADQRFDTAAVAEALRSRGREAQASGSAADALETLQRVAGAATMAAPQMVVFFSNGSFDGIISRFAQAVRSGN